MNAETLAVGSLSVRAKLWILMGIFVLGLVGFGSYAFHNRNVVEVNGPLYHNIVQAKDLIADVVPPPEFIVESYLLGFQMLDEADHARLDKLMERVKVLRDRFNERHDYWMAALPESTLKNKLLVESYRPAREFFDLWDQQFVPALLRNELETSARLLNGPLHDKYEEHRARIEEVIVLAAEQSRLEEGRAGEAITRGTHVLLALIVVIAALATLLGWQIGRSIVDPLRRTVEVLEGVASGDLTRQSEFNSDDEVGRMSRALDQAVGEMRAAIQEISSNAQSLAGASEELAAVSQQMSDNAESAAGQANVASAASQQVSRNLETVATGTEEMGASIKEIAKNASEAAKVATAAVRMAEVTNTTVAKLGESSAEIGKVSKVITSIAEQTNLLALNATIEAARAGEAGKGFAVVANEVKELAKETARATEDISSKIQAIQADTRSAVTAIEEITGIINQINDISSTIASSVEEQSATTSEIGRNVGEAAKGSNEIVQSILGVAETAKSTTTGASDMHRAAGELARMAAELERLVARFKVERDHTPRVAAGGRRGVKVSSRSARLGVRPDGPAHGPLPVGV